MELGAARLPVTDLGVGEAVMLLHAGVADRRSWDAVSVLLRAASWRTVAYDRRGFGNASAGPVTHSHTADMFEVLAASGIDRAVLVGNSQGGRIAVEAALAQPERVLALVLVGTSISGAPGPDEVESLAISDLAEAIEAAEAAGDLDSVNELEAQLWLDGPTSQHGRVEPALRELFLEMNGIALRSADVGESEWSDNSWDELEGIDVPTLVVVGDLDLPHIVRRSRMVAERIPGAALVRLPGRAHLPAFEDPAGFASAIVPFLSGLRTR